MYVYAIREDRGDSARWLKEFAVGPIKLLQFEDLRPEDLEGLVLFRDQSQALTFIAANQFCNGAVIVECEVAEGALVIVSAP